MNPGVTEEVAKVATTTVEALKQTPAILCLVLFNVAFMAMVGFISARSSSAWNDENARMHDLVAKCVSAQQFKLQSDESSPVTLPPQLKADPKAPEQIPDIKPKL